MEHKSFIELWVGKDATRVARRFRRWGYEAHVSSKAWVRICFDGADPGATSDLRRALFWIAPAAVIVDWGDCEE